MFRGELGVFPHGKLQTDRLMEGYSVEAMSGSFLSKLCVEKLGDDSLKSSRGP